jgi:CheY-like chemotaxis protein
MKILITDDEEIIRDTLNTILTKAGHTTELALDGAEALAKIKETIYDIALLDIDMPKLDGYEVLKQIRALYPLLPVIFITGSGESKKVAQSIAQYHLNAFIEKPFTPETVLDVINKSSRPKSAAI